MPRQVVLSYSTPRILLDRPYRHRSGNAVAGIVTVAVMGCICGGMAMAMSRSSATPFVVGRMVLGCLALACAAGLVTLVVKAYRDDRDHVRITHEGIELKSQVYPWESIGFVYGIKLARGVMIQFELRDVRDRSKQFGPVFHVPRQVLTTPFPTLEEFEQLIDALTAEVLPQHPHLKLERGPRSGG
jgi:hypothetical protein